MSEVWDMWLEAEKRTKAARRIFADRQKGSSLKCKAEFPRSLGERGSLFFYGQF